MQTKLNTFEKGAQITTSTDQPSEVSDEPRCTSQHVDESLQHAAEDEDASVGGHGGDPHGSTQADGEPPLCPTYEEERTCEKWQQLKDKHSLQEPKCGHAIRYLRDVTESKISGTTARGYSSSLKYLVRFLHNREVTVPEAEFRDFDDFYGTIAQGGVVSGTLRKYMGSTNNLLRHMYLKQDVDLAVDYGILRDECSASDYNARKSETRSYLTKDEIDELIDAIDELYDGAVATRNKLLVQAGVELGPRATDLVTIELDDVDLDDRTIRLKNSKAGGRYRLPLSANLTLKLRRWIHREREALVREVSNPYLFPSKQGGCLKRNSLWPLIDEAAEEAGLQEEITVKSTPAQREYWGDDVEEWSFHRISPHSLRHSFAMLLQEEGVPVEGISQALDHEGIDVTRDHYLHDEESILDLLDDIFDDFDL